MPIYEFRCKNCGYKFEELIFTSLSKINEVVCPKCGNKNAEKLMSACSSSATGEAGLASAPSCGSSRFS
jgi:putative FmdB family regulatory protein